MKRITKSKKIDFLGITLKISLSYPARKKLPRLIFPYNLIKKIAFLLLTFLVVFGAGKGLVMLFYDNSYYTKTSPFLEKVSPILGKVKKDRPILFSSNRNRIIFHGYRGMKQLALTFDADMTPEMKQNLESGAVASYYDRRIIDILTETNTKATLFLAGMWIEAYRELSKSLANNSLFELANHSYSHPSFDGDCYGLLPSNDDQDKLEIEKTQELLKEITGVENKSFRFPGGCYSQKDLDIASKAGVLPIQWDAEGQDGFNTDRQFIENNVIENVKNGSIIVLHMNGFPNEPETANALPNIITELKKKGFTFVKMSELLQTDKLEAKNVKDFLKYQYSFLPE